MVTSLSIMVYGPIVTFSPRVTSSPIIAVGWILIEIFTPYRSTRLANKIASATSLLST